MKTISALTGAPWSILDDVASLRSDFNDLFETWGRPRYQTAAVPPVNVWASEQGLEIEAELPGVDPSAVEITVRDDELALKGTVESGAATDRKPEVYHRRERPAGAFARSIQLPYRVASDKVKAAYRNGILHISVPRADSDKPRRIAIEAA